MGTTTPQEHTTSSLTEQDWETFDEAGYLVLGKVLGAADLRALDERIDAIMLGEAELDYRALMMQLDGNPEQSTGFKGPTLAYRKIQGLELDPLFRAYLRRPLFRDACRHVYGEVPVSCFRAMFMNKPARLGTVLPWHQDRWSFLDRDPLLTVWTALDPATAANGCVKVIPGSHRWGLVNPDDRSGFLTGAQVAEHRLEEAATYLELEPGQAVLLHNWLLHSSEVNQTDVPRRAFSVCYMDGRTRHQEAAEDYSLVFGGD